MSVVFDPFTGQIIDTGSSAGMAIGGPVAGADPNAILLTDGATNLTDIQLADGEVLIGKTGDAPIATTITGTTNQISVTNGPNSITLSTPQDIDSTASPTFANLNLTPNGALDTTTSGILDIGTTEATTINIGNAGTTVNIYGDTIYQNVTNLNVTDKNITVNNGGSIDTSFNSGIHVYENGVPDAGYLEVTLDMLGWKFKAPHDTGIAVINPGPVGFTIDQGSHNPITIAVPANGLAIDDPYNQELSIALADASTTGALSSTDWNTFNNKQDAYIFKVDAYDPINTSLPTVDPVIIDGHTIINNDRVAFSNLSSGNNQIYQATVSGASVSWTSVASPAINDYILVKNGDGFALQAGVFTGTSFDFNRVIRHFNGADYWEQSAIYTVPLANASSNNVFTINVSNSENMIIDYSIYRGTRKTTGTLYLVSDGTTVQVSDVGVDLNSPVGVSFSASISIGQITLTCTTDASGDSGTLKYNLRRWSDSAGGPGGLPSYSGGGGSGSITVEQLNGAGAGSYSNINTIKFNNDTGFLVTDLGGGEVEINLGSTFKTWNIDNGAGPAQPSLVAVGEDTIEFIAGTGIEFQTDNTPGAKTFTINSTGGGSSVQTATLSNNATDQNVTGFVVDPTLYDGFTADIVITRDVPAGVELKPASPLNTFFNTVLELKDGSIILYNSDTMSGVYTVKKINSTGNVDLTFNTGTGFNGAITKIIDVTEDITNSVLAVFGAFTDYNGNARNRVCFIDGNTGADLFDLYDGFGISSGGSGFQIGTINSVTKIKYTSNIASSTSPYGYLICGSMDYFNDPGLITPLTSKLILVSCQRGQGFIEIPNSLYASTSYMLTPANKSIANISFSISPSITLPSVPWSDSQEFYYRLNTTALNANDLSGTINSGYGYMITTVGNGPSPSPAIINSIDTNQDGSALFVGGDFVYADLSSVKSLAKFDVPSISSSSRDVAFDPLNSQIGAIVYKVDCDESFIRISGYSITLAGCQNFSGLNYDGTVNSSINSIFGSGFPIDPIFDFSSNFFLQIKPGPAFGYLYGLTAPVPASYVTKMYGCNEYTGMTPSMIIQGYSYAGGLYPGVSFDIDSSGQLKYTSSNIPDGSSFTMKYLLTKL